MSRPALQVLVCAFGPQGAQRIASLPHPRIDGVEYLVSWQLPDGDAPVPGELMRPDFRILKSDTRGLSRNRNIALDAADADIILIADDDLSYTPDQLRGIISAFAARPGDDMIFFRYASDEGRSYPDREFPLSNPPKGWFPTSMEMAFRLDSLRNARLRFNEHFGVGADFIAGEESILLHDALRAGLRGHFVPFTVCTHFGPTSATRLGRTPEFIEMKGAMHFGLHRFSWPLRMIAAARREAGGGISFFRYVASWMKGAAKASRKGAFRG